VTNRLGARTRPLSWAIGEAGPMCDRLPSENRRDLAADVPLRGTRRASQSSRADFDHLRRLAEACRDLVDAVVMARAWGDADDTREGMRG
jgi:hypothetical protein